MMGNQKNSRLFATISLLISLFTYQSFSNIAFAIYDVKDLQTRLNTLNTYKETAQILIRQKEQLEIEIDNAKNLTNFDWSKVDQTITELLKTIDSISQYQDDLEEHLSQFQDLEYYQSSSCFSSSGCSAKEMEAIQENKISSSSAQKEANDAMIRGLVLQQDNLEEDAKELANLQTKTTTAAGQMAAMQYANQLASSQANQLMHIRGLLIAEQTAAAARAQEIADSKAQQEAASLQLREGEYKESPSRNWLGVMP